MSQMTQVTSLATDCTNEPIMNPPATPSTSGQGVSLPEDGTFYRHFFAVAFEGMAVSENGRILDFNAEALRAFGYTREELIGTELVRLVAPESRAAVATAVAANSDALYVLTFLHKDGSRFEAEAQAKVVVIGGRHLRLTVLRDITARRQSEESLHDSQLRLRLAMGMARLGQWELDLAANRFTFDDTFLQLLGTNAVQEGGHTMMADDYARRFIPPEEMAVVGREIAAASATTDPDYNSRVEHRFIRADGSRGIMLVQIAVVKDAAGRTVRTYGVNQDVTEQRQAEQQRIRLETQLQQAQKMEALGTLAGGIAHDFNNILTGILGQLQLTEMDIPPGHPSRAGLAEAAKAGRRARELVARILAFSRHNPRDRKPLALGPVISEALQLLRASLPATIEIRPQIAPDCPPVLCDSAQIHQILMNLGTNAVHAMRERGGVLTVSLARVSPSTEVRRQHPQVRAEHIVRLSVRDNGSGMDETVLKRIFEPFFTTKETGQGTGLGLTMVYSIIQDHLGAIVAESTPGKGTVFDLYFPAAAGAARPVNPTTPPLVLPTGQFGRGRRLMLVDDDEDVRGVGASMLRRLGFLPAVYASPLEALSAFRAAPGEVCAVLSDLTMPGLTGVELARQLTLIRPGLPMILASGYLDNQAMVDAKQSGVNHIIRKPFELHDLATQLRAVLGEPVA